MDIKNEKGFTLMEMILVLAILIVFLAAMTSLLLTTTKLTTEITQDNNSKSVHTLVLSHIEQSVQEHEVKGAIQIIHSSTYNSVLQIDTIPGNVNSVKLYYFYDASDEILYFQASQHFDPANKNISIKLADHVKTFDVSLSSVQKTLRMNIHIKAPEGVIKYTETIALKTY